MFTTTSTTLHMGMLEAMCCTSFAPEAEADGTIFIDRGHVTIRTVDVYFGFGVGDIFSLLHILAGHE